MNYVNALSFLPECFPEGQFSLPAWRDYAGRISPGLASKCEADVADYDFDREVVPVVQSALNRPDELARLQETFLAVTRQGQERMSLLFRQEPDICILLYLGLCSGAGWATSLDERPAVLLGAEKILELGWQAPSRLSSLLFHEIGHLWHWQAGRAALPRKAPRQRWTVQLYDEGIAMVCEQLLGDAPERFHQDQDGWLDWCRQQEEPLKKEFLARLERGESLQDFFGDWNSYQGHSNVGYFLGRQLIRHMMNRRSLPEIAALSYEEIDAACVAFLRESGQ